MRGYPLIHARHCPWVWQCRRCDGPIQQRLPLRPVQTAVAVYLRAQQGLQQAGGADALSDLGQARIMTGGYAVRGQCIMIGPTLGLMSGFAWPWHTSARLQFQV